MPVLAHTRAGSGEPLVLLHGLGLSRRSWGPVIPLLAERFDVIAIDLPGFGDSASLPQAVEPHPAALATVVAMTLSQLGVESPHVAGNSLGGWVSLELAALVPLRSLTLVSPAGLWRDHTPLYCRMSLRGSRSRFLARYGGPLLRPLARYRLARMVMFGQSIGHPARMTPSQARAALTDMARCPGFRATFRATLERAYTAQGPIEAPVSVSFGSRDLILLPGQSRHLDQLPPQTVLTSMTGAGHVPMTDDPAGVASLIIRTAGR